MVFFADVARGILRSSFVTAKAFCVIDSSRRRTSDRRRLTPVGLAAPTLADTSELHACVNPASRVREAYMGRPQVVFRRTFYASTDFLDVVGAQTTYRRAQPVVALPRNSSNPIPAIDSAGRGANVAASLRPLFGRSTEQSSSTPTGSIPCAYFLRSPTILAWRTCTKTETRNATSAAKLWPGQAGLKGCSDQGRRDGGVSACPRETFGAEVTAGWCQG